MESAGAAVLSAFYESVARVSLCASREQTNRAFLGPARPASSPQRQPSTCFDLGNSARERCGAVPSAVGGRALCTLSACFHLEPL